MTLLEIRNLKKYFDVRGGQLHAVDNLSFDIQEGKTLGVVGESGCGKSTLGKTILRLLEPTDGEIWYEGIDVAQLSMKEFKEFRPKMQMIFQDPYSSLDPRMTVYQLIAEPLEIFKRLKKDRKGVQTRVNALMDMVGLTSRLRNSYPHELDGGRRQRIGIARALALNPDFLICDEPVSALDVSIQAQILNLLQDLQEERNLTYMFITHDMSVVKHIADEICVMYLGQIVEKCPTKELFSDTLHPYSQALLAAILVPNIHLEKRKVLMRGELASPINPKRACRFAPRCAHAVEQCFREEPELREIKKGHWVLCHLVEDLQKGGASVEE